MGTNTGLGEFQVGPDGLIDRLPCRDCGTPTLSVREVLSDDVPVMWAYVCRPCQAKDDAETVDLRAKFDEMIAAGVSPETANAAMIRWHVRSSRNA